MHKISVVCSFLAAFSLSAMIAGCEPTKPPVKQMPKSSSSGGSTTGGGTTVPNKPSKGTVETPKATEPAPKEDEKAQEAPKDGDVPKSDEKTKEGE